MQLDPDSEHIKSGFYRRLMRNIDGGRRGWRPLRMSETVPPTERTLKIITKREAERKKRQEREKQEA